MKHATVRFAAPAVALLWILAGCRDKAPAPAPPEPASAEAPAPEPAPTEVSAPEPAPPPSPDEGLRAKAQAAWDAGRAATLKLTKLEPSDVWCMQQALAVQPDAELQRHVERLRETLRADPFYRLVQPAAPRPVLPPEPGAGLMKLYSYLMASVADPEDRALATLREYLALDGADYVLTHQLLVLDWSRDAGRALPDDLTRQAPALLDKILAEHSKDTAFSDLYAERAAILIQHGVGSPEAQAEWIRIIVDAQQPDGTWGNLSWDIEFDGQKATTRNSASHTITLSMMALRLWLGPATAK
jgi:hypothetical protein